MTSPLEYVRPTKRRKMTQARAARIFVSRNGICILCGQQIVPGQDWFIEHPDSLALGGSDSDDDLHPAHERCKPAKDAQDAAAKAKRDRVICKGWSGKRKARPMPGSKASGFKRRMDGTVVRRET